MAAQVAASRGQRTGAQTVQKEIIIQITITPGRRTRSAQTYEARLDGRLLCDTSTPLLSAARILLAEGRDPDETLKMVREGSSRVDLSARLGTAARLAVRDGVAQGPVFATYRPHPGAPESE